MLLPGNYKDRSPYKTFARYKYSIFVELGINHISLCVLVTSLNYLIFSLVFRFRALLVSQKKNVCFSHFIPKANPTNVFSVLSESSVSVLNYRPVACL